MFTQFKNIDTAFRHIKVFSIVFLLANACCICCCLYCFYRLSSEKDQRVYILSNGKLLEAVASDKKSNLQVELRDHIKVFHERFFTLSPDDKAIQKNVERALYLADVSAKRQFDNLKESGYFNNLIAANISQQIEIDSTVLDVESYPYHFTCYATQHLVRASGSTLRRLVTRGQVRDMQQKTDNNPHGFLIQRWETLQNRDSVAKP